MSEEQWRSRLPRHRPAATLFARPQSIENAYAKVKSQLRPPPEPRIAPRAWIAALTATPLRRQVMRHDDIARKRAGDNRLIDIGAGGHRVHWRVLTAWSMPYGANRR